MVYRVMFNVGELRGVGKCTTGLIKIDKKRTKYLLINESH